MKNIKKPDVFLHVPAMCKVLPCILLLASCSRRTIPVRSERADSVRVERVVEYRERLRIDTVRIEIPAQNSQRETWDSASHLETNFALSDARINPDGTLYHDLRNKARKWPVSVLVADRETVSRRDSIVYRDVSVEVPVKMPLSWWEQTQIRGFKIMLAVIVVVAGIYCFNRFKRFR